eukprot:jgi/Chrzof1/5290/Cz15g21010.t1
MWTVRYFECRYEKYNWQGISQLPTLKQKAQRSVEQFLPYSWTKFNWMVFSSPRRCLESMFVVLIMLAFEVNVFFLKYALWIPPTNPLNTYRLLLWFACALPGVREYYEFIEHRGGSSDVSSSGSSFRQLGPFAWLAIAMTCLETMASIKFGAGLYPKPWPLHVLWFWGIVASGFAVVLLVWQARQRRSGILGFCASAAGSINSSKDNHASSNGASAPVLEVVRSKQQ